MHIKLGTPELLSESTDTQSVDPFVGGQLNALEISQLSAFKTGHSIDLTLSAD